MRKTEEVPDHRFLQRRRQTWYVRVAVPPSLVPKLGKQSIIKSLKTRDARVARERRWEAVAAIKRELAQLAGAAPRDLVPLGLEYREFFETAGPPPRDRDEELTSRYSEVRYELLTEVDELRDAGREEEAKRLYRIATTDDAVLAEAGERWLAEIAGTVAEQTRRQHRHALGLLREAFPEALFAGDIDRRKAGRFVSEVLRGRGLANKTINRILSSLSSFWKWMLRRGWTTAANPWSGQGDYSRKRRRGPEAKRAYTEGELLALLNADAERLMGAANGRAIGDLVRLGLMTGARLNELCELQARDVLVADRAIHIRGGKTENARRTIPVHAAVWPVVEQRLAAAGAGRDTPLFPELKPGGPDRKRSWYISKVFTVYRRRVLGEGDDVDFHSLRRTFATYLEHASTRTTKVNLQVIAQLMGHEKSSLATKLYSSGLLIQHLREAIDLLAEVIEPEVLEALGRTR